MPVAATVYPLPLQNPPDIIIPSGVLCEAPEAYWLLLYWTVIDAAVAVPVLSTKLAWVPPVAWLSTFQLLGGKAPGNLGGRGPPGIIPPPCLAFKLHANARLGVRLRRCH